MGRKSRRRGGGGGQIHLRDCRREIDPLQRNVSQDIVQGRLERAAEGVAIRDERRREFHGGPGLYWSWFASDVLSNASGWTRIVVLCFENGIIMETTRGEGTLLVLHGPTMRTDFNCAGVSHGLQRSSRRSMEHPTFVEGVRHRCTLVVGESTKGHTWKEKNQTGQVRQPLSFRRKNFHRRPTDDQLASQPTCDRVGGCSVATGRHLPSYQVIERSFTKTSDGFKRHRYL